MEMINTKSCFFAGPSMLFKPHFTFVPPLCSPLLHFVVPVTEHEPHVSRRCPRVTAVWRGTAGTRVFVSSFRYKLFISSISCEALTLMMTLQSSIVCQFFLKFTTLWEWKLYTSGYGYCYEVLEFLIFTCFLTIVFAVRCW